jgi:hypothetical protein
MLDRLLAIAREAGLDPDAAMQMTVLDFMRAVAERRAARGERSEWLSNVLDHCNKAKATSLATMSALGKSSSKVRKAVGS